MAWNVLRRLRTLAPPAPKIILANVEEVHFEPVGPDATDPQAIERAHELEEQLRRELVGIRDPSELRARMERFEREHGMTEISHEEGVPEVHTTVWAGGTRLRGQLDELKRELEGVDDPAELKTRTERFAREHGWTVESDTGPVDAPSP